MRGKAAPNDSLPDLHAAILTGRPVPACELNPELHSSFQAILDRALEKDRGARYQTAEEMVSDLRRLHEPSRPASTGAAVKSQTGRRKRPGKYVWAILFAALLLLPVATAVTWYYRHRREASRLTDKDMIVLADFANSTGDPIFDDTLRQATTLALRQSPFLRIVSDQDVRSTLKLMSPAHPTLP